MDKIPGSVRLCACLLDPCPSWWVRSAWVRLVEWVGIVWQQVFGRGCDASFKLSVCPLLRELFLDTIAMGTYGSVLNLLFRGRVLIHLVAVAQLYGSLDETYYLDPFHSSFHSKFRKEVALLALVELDRKTAFRFDVSISFSTINQGSLLAHHGRMYLTELVCSLQSFLEGQFQNVWLLWGPTGFNSVLCTF